MGIRELITSSISHFPFPISQYLFLFSNGYHMNPIHLSNKNT